MSAITIIDKHNGTDAATAASSSRQYCLITISNQEYLTLPTKNDIYEVQSVSPNNGKYASYMVGSRFISNPDLHVVSRVDPLYFALEHFAKAANDNNAEEDDRGGKWQPWDQLLKGIPKPVLDALNTSLNITTIKEVGQLAHLLEVSDVFDDDIVCKFSEKKALAWLNAKFDRSFEALRKRKLEKKQRLQERKQSGEYGAFSSSFVMADDSVEKKLKDMPDAEGGEAQITLTKDEDHIVRIASLQVLSEYLSPSWRMKLAESLNLSEEVIEKKTKAPTTSGEKRPRASWEGAVGQAEADELLCLTTGQSKATSVTPVEKNVKNAQTVGLKRLAKVNTKGMKSLTSFFGGKKKKC